MPIRLDSHSLLIDPTADPVRAVDEASDDAFDRAAFARYALALLRRSSEGPPLRVAICESASRMRVETGRAWGRDERWALFAIPPRASRRAIALAAAELTRSPRAYALDVLMAEPREASRGPATAPDAA